MSGSSNELEASLESSVNTAKCRICWRTSYIIDLLSPCVCTGSQKYVHFDCLSRWIQERNSDDRDICDVCQHHYENISITMKKKNFIQWLREGEDVIATICIVFIMFAFFYYILNMGCIQFIISEGRIHNVIRYCQLALTIFLGIIFVVAIITALFVCRANFKEWQTSHFSAVVHRINGSRRSTISSLTSTHSSSTNSSSHNNIEPEDDRKLMAINSITTNTQDYGSIC